MICWGFSCKVNINFWSRSAVQTLLLTWTKLNSAKFVWNIVMTDLTDKWMFPKDTKWESGRCCLQDTDHKLKYFVQLSRDIDQMGILESRCCQGWVCEPHSCLTEWSSFLCVPSHPPPPVENIWNCFELLWRMVACSEVHPCSTPCQNAPSTSLDRIPSWSAASPPPASHKRHKM